MTVPAAAAAMNITKTSIIKTPIQKTVLIVMMSLMVMIMVVSVIVILLQRLATFPLPPGSGVIFSSGIYVLWVIVTAIIFGTGSVELPLPPPPPPRPDQTVGNEQYTVVMVLVWALFSLRATSTSFLSILCAFRRQYLQRTEFMEPPLRYHAKLPGTSAGGGGLASLTHRSQKSSEIRW